MADTKVDQDREAVEQRRQDRYRLRHTLWQVSKVRRLLTCGRGVRGDAVTIKVGADQDGHRRAAAEGLVTCASVWSCPVCAVHIRVARSLELALAVERHREAGGGLVFVTLTMRHERGDDLAGLLNRLYGTWGKVQRRRDWCRPGGPRSGPGIKARLGIVGWVRAAEVTYGVNGWHPHLHILLFTEAPVSQGERDDLLGWLEGAWIGTLRRSGGDALEGVGVDVRRVTGDSKAYERLAGYTAKAETAHLEVTRGDAKAPRSGESWSTWNILDAAGDGETWAVLAWQEYEAATSARRAIEWSRGLRDRLDLGDEATDDEVAGDVLDDQAEVVAVIPSATWRQVCRWRLDYGVLDAARRVGADGVGRVVTAALIKSAERDGRPPG